MSATRHRQDGFSLVEVALALMVVGVGMVAIFSVIPAGLDANKRAIDDSQEAMFAEEIFNAYRVQAERLPWAQLSGTTIQNITPDMWEDSSLTAQAGAARTNVYERKGMGLIEFAVRYQLQIADLPNQRKALTLNVWNGQYGNSANPSVYYTEIRRSRP